MSCTWNALARRWKASESCVPPGTFRFPFLLFSVVGVLRIVHGIVQSAAFLPLYGLPGYQVADVDHVAQFADVLRRLHPFEEVFRLLIQQVQPVPRTLQAQIAAHDADVVAHDFADFLDALRDQDVLFIGHRSLVVPFGNVRVVVVAVYHPEGMFGCRLGVDDGFYQ